VFLHECHPETTQTAKEGQNEVYFLVENILTYKQLARKLKRSSQLAIFLSDVFQ
jgi:hypothetical protein